MVNMTGTLQGPAAVLSSVLINWTDEDIEHRGIKFAMTPIFEGE